MPEFRDVLTLARSFIASHQRQLHRWMLYSAAESIWRFHRRSGKIAAAMLFKAQWGFDTPEWFDARLSLLYPEKWFTDGSHVSRGSIIGVLPIGGSILDLCGGDGFLPFYAYSRRASQVVSVDYNKFAHDHAVKNHSKKNIKYLLADIFSFDPGEAQFDVVALRGAIEHFSEPDQLRILDIAWRALKPGGWFCGDTPANPRKDTALLVHHHHEFAGEGELRHLLERVFPDVQTTVFQSCETVSYMRDELPTPENIRTTLIWRCRKPAV